MPLILEMVGAYFLCDINSYFLKKEVGTYESALGFYQ